MSKIDESGGIDADARRAGSPRRSRAPRPRPGGARAKAGRTRPASRHL